jgi:DNA-binding CsgD family transcriptional regulator
MTQAPFNRIYPGMMDNSIEFFMNNNELNVIENSKIKPFCELSFNALSILNETINQDINVKLALFEMHPTSPMQRVEQFARCRFGGLDFQADIKDGQLQDGEFWECPNRGNCPHEGTLCKLPSFKNERLTKQEVELIQLSSSDKINEVIADEMHLPMGSFHKAKKILYERLGVQTKQEVARIGLLLNLI